MRNTIKELEKLICKIFGKDTTLILFNNFIYFNSEDSFSKVKFKNESSFLNPVMYKIKETYEASYDIEGTDLNNFLLLTSLFNDEKKCSIFIETKDLMNFINFRFDTSLRKKKVQCAFDFESSVINFNSSSRILKKSTYHLNRKYNSNSGDKSAQIINVNCFELYKIISFLVESKVHIIRVDLLDLNKIRIVSKRNGFENIFILLGKV